MSEPKRRRRATPVYDSAESDTNDSSSSQPASAYSAPTIVNNITVSPSASYGSRSYFDGGLLSWIGWSILAVLITLFTFGICYPFAICLLYKWEARHTVINGRRLYFDGTGMQLFGKWILWFVLTIITLGIYSFWLFIKLKQWKTLHTHFE